MEKYEKQNMIYDLETVIKSCQKDHTSIDDIKSVFRNSYKENQKPLRRKSRHGGQSPTKSKVTNKPTKNYQTRQNDSDYYDDSNDEFINEISQKGTKSNVNKKGGRKPDNDENNDQFDFDERSAHPPVKSFKLTDEGSQDRDDGLSQNGVYKKAIKRNKSRISRKKYQDHDSFHDTDLDKKSRITEDNIYKQKYEKAKDKLDEIFTRLRNSEKELLQEKALAEKNKLLIADQEHNKTRTLSEKSIIHDLNKKLLEKDQQIGHNEIELSNLRNTKTLYQKFKEEFNKDKRLIIELEDENKKIKNSSKNNETEKEQIKLLLKELEDCKSDINDHLRDKDRLGDDIQRLTEETKRLKDNRTGSIKDKEIDFIRLKEDNDNKEYQIKELEKDKDNYYNEYRLSKENLIKKDKDILRQKREIEDKDQAIKSNQGDEVILIVNYHKIGCQKNTGAHICDKKLERRE